MEGDAAVFLLTKFVLPAAFIVIVAVNLFSLYSCGNVSSITIDAMLLHVKFQLFRHLLAEARRLYFDVQPLDKLLGGILEERTWLVAFEAESAIEKALYASDIAVKVVFGIGMID